MQRLSTSATVEGFQILEASQSPAPRYMLVLSTNVFTAILISQLDRSRALILDGCDTIDDEVKVCRYRDFQHLVVIDEYA
jgi:hypothetical protein